jgi:hypothetical protein
MPSVVPMPSREEGLSKSENDLVESLRLVIQHAIAQAGGGGDEQPAGAARQRFRISQLVFIVALALDLALIYVYVLDVFGDLEQNRVVSSLAKLLPIVGGTLLVSYLDHVRAGILKLTAKNTFGWGCIAVLPLLLAFQIHFYTLFVDLHPATAHVQVLDKKGVYHDADFTDPTHRAYLKLSNPSAYKIRLENDNWSVYEVSAWQVVKGTLARLPMLDHHFSPLQMDVLNEVIFLSPKPDGALIVDGPDTPGMKISKLSKIANPAAIPAKPSPGNYLWMRNFSDDDSPSVHLPAGKYNFILQVEGCPTLRMEGTEVPVADGKSLAFPQGCSK